MVKKKYYGLKDENFDKWQENPYRIPLLKQRYVKDVSWFDMIVKKWNQKYFKSRQWLFRLFPSSYF